MSANIFGFQRVEHMNCRYTTNWLKVMNVLFIKNTFNILSEIIPKSCGLT